MISGFVLEVANRRLVFVLIFTAVNTLCVVWPASYSHVTDGRTDGREGCMSHVPHDTRLIQLSSSLTDCIQRQLGRASLTACGILCRSAFVWPDTLMVVSEGSFLFWCCHSILCRLIVSRLFEAKGLLCFCLSYRNYFYYFYKGTTEGHRKPCYNALSSLYCTCCD